MAAGLAAMGVDTGGTCKAAVSGYNGLWAVCGVSCCKCVDNL